jgi:DHA2 family multidrug resistance protein-like MFS transporter
MSEFGGALGIAVFGSLGTALYRRALVGAMPEGVSPAAASDALATLGAAAATATALPEPVGTALFAAASAAFVDAMQVTAVACAVVLLAACVVTARILRT